MHLLVVESDHRWEQLFERCGEHVGFEVVRSCQSLDALHDCLHRHAPATAAIVGTLPEPSELYRALEMLRAASADTQVLLCPSAVFTEFDVVRSSGLVDGVVSRRDEDTMGEIRAALRAETRLSFEPDHEGPQPRLIGAGGFDEFDLERVLARLFPLDSQVRVLSTPKGLSGMFGVSVVVTGVAQFRATPSFYFLKLGVGEAGRAGIFAERERFSQLWCALDGADGHMPRLFGWVSFEAVDDQPQVTVAIYEYVAMAPPLQMTSRHVWQPRHLSAYIEAEDFKEAGPAFAIAMKQIQRPLRSLRKHARLANELHAPDADRIEELRRRAVDSICKIYDEPAAAALGEVLSTSPTLRFEIVEMQLPTIAADEAEEAYRNPIVQLCDLPLQPHLQAMVSCAVHGDLHCENLVLSNRFAQAKWMLIDFGHAMPSGLATLDVARLECDLLFRRADPGISVSNFHDDIRRLFAWFHGEVEELRWIPKRLVNTIHELRRTAIRDLGDVDPSVEDPTSQLLWALLYECVRWLGHTAAPRATLKRLVCALEISAALEALADA